LKFYKLNVPGRKKRFQFWNDFNRELGWKNNCKMDDETTFFEWVSIMRHSFVQYTFSIAVLVNFSRKGIED